MFAPLDLFDSVFFSLNVFGACGSVPYACLGPLLSTMDVAVDEASMVELLSLSTLDVSVDEGD